MAAAALMGGQGRALAAIFHQPLIPPEPLSASTVWGNTSNNIDNVKMKIFKLFRADVMTPAQEPKQRKTNENKYGRTKQKTNDFVWFGASGPSKSNPGRREPPACKL